MNAPLLRWFAFAVLAAAGLAKDAPRPWPADAFLPVTLDRIAALPATEQPAWRAYWEKSARLAVLVAPRDLTEYAPDHPLAGPPVPAIYSAGVRLDAPAAWYATEDARAIADRVVTWQTPVGAWTKGGDYSREFRPGDNLHDEFSGGTYDNDSTINELRYLARVSHAAEASGPRATAWCASFLRGLAYLFDSQYPNGGFPQIYPLAGSYHDAITFNDDVVVRNLELLREIGAGGAEFAFVPAESAALARERFATGVRNLLACQLRGPDGRPTIWGQQHDALTLKPCAARNFEPAGECSRESIALVRFLMAQPRPDAEIVAAVHGAMAWFDHHALHGVVWDRNAPAGTGLAIKVDAPDLWARLYEFGTGKPIFGERDRMIHYDLAELSFERRKGYGWFTPLPGKLTPLYAQWKKSAPAAQ